FFEPDAFDRQANRDLEDPPWARSVVWNADGQDGARGAVRSARGADIVVKTSGVGVHDALLEEAVLELKSERTRVVFWDVDAPATLDRVEKNPDDPFRRLIPEYDLILTYGGGRPVIDAYERLGARACHCIYNGVDPSTHYPVPPDPRFEATLGFLGNRMPDRESRVREFFFEPAAALSHHRFLLGGNGWHENVPDLPNVLRLGHVYTKDHNAFNATPLAVLNINRESMARYGFSPPTRVFEAAGAGACLITDAWEGVDLFLEPDRECLVVRSGREVVEALEDLDVERARAMGQAALERVLSSHTYERRAETVESLFEPLFARSQEVIK
ncbi:MAG TPA: glycosyltransferase, partial [Planctomycetota bacterium]|nr:glycosyltransferase [Planctomycetota bacterium]